MANDDDFHEVGTKKGGDDRAGKRPLIDNREAVPDLEDDADGARADGSMVIRAEDLADDKKGKRDERGGNRADDVDDDEPGGDRRVSARDRAEAGHETEEERRESRRDQRRREKDARRRARDRNIERNRALERQVATLQEQVTALRGGQVRATASTVEERIANARGIHAGAEAELAKAVENGDGAGAVAAQRKLSAALSAIEKLGSYKATLERRAREETDRGDAGGGDAAPEKLTSEGRRLAVSWARRNAAFYDAQDDDPDSVSEEVREIDRELTSEGWSLNDPERWRELTKRTQHLRDGEDDDETRDASSRRREDDETPRRRGGSPPGGSGRGSAGSRAGEWILSAERIKAMKEAGKWDDAALRKKQIKAYQQYDAEARSSQRG